MAEDKYPYKVYDQEGQLCVQAPVTCRYPKKTELEILEAGYTIKINGKRLTKKEVAARGA